jgi:hypothetical protein
MSKTALEERLDKRINASLEFKQLEKEIIELQYELDNKKDALAYMKRTGRTEMRA